MLDRILLFFLVFSSVSLIGTSSSRSLSDGSSSGDSSSEYYDSDRSVELWCRQVLVSSIRDTYVGWKPESCDDRWLRLEVKRLCEQQSVRSDAERGILDRLRTFFANLMSHDE